MQLASAAAMAAAVMAAAGGERSAWGEVGNAFAGGVLDAMSVVLVDLAPAGPLAAEIPDLTEMILPDLGDLAVADDA